MNRSTFFKGVAAGVIGLPVVLRVFMGDEAVAQQDHSSVDGRRFEWKMVTTWPPTLPILADGCKMLAELVRKMSNGRLDITVYGGGELVPALESFDTVRQGGAQMGSGVAYYWSGKVPAAQYFGGIPLGFNAQEMNAWLISGGGLELWRELYAQYNLRPFIGGNTGGQMGGWFNKEINTLSDLRGLKMRMPGIGGRVLQRLGGSPVLKPAGELYTSLERGLIDALEWIGPFHDYEMGFHEIAKYYYYPGWHEPGSCFEFTVNLDAWNELPTDLQTILETATHLVNLYTLCEFEARNAETLATIKSLGTVELRAYPEEVLDAARIAAKEVAEELADSDPFARRVYDSILAFRARSEAWGDVGLQASQTLG
ncbi:MAG: TRAP transporter substrate-binding protein [Bacteroidota bacterium]